MPQKMLSTVGWSIDHTTGSKDGVPSLPRTVATYLDEAIVVRAVGGRVDIIEFNPARLLRGHHGSLIKSEDEMALAFRMLRERLSEISHSDDEKFEFELIYVELGWNFLYPFSKLYRYLLLTKNPFGPRAVDREERDHCAFLSSTGGVKIYNKTKVMRKHGEAGADAPEVTRFEVTLKKAKIKKLFRRTKFTDSIPFDLAYDWLRRCVSLIEATPACSTAKTKQEKIAAVCALAGKAGLGFPGGQSVLDYLNEGVGVKTATKLKLLTQSATFQMEAFSWTMLFPEEDVPPAVEFPKRPQKRA